MFKPCVECNKNCLAKCVICKVAICAKCYRRVMIRGQDFTICQHCSPEDIRVKLKKESTRVWKFNAELI